MWSSSSLRPSMMACFYSASSEAKSAKFSIMDTISARCVSNNFTDVSRYVKNSWDAGTVLFILANASSTSFWASSSSAAVVCTVSTSIENNFSWLRIRYQSTYIWGYQSKPSSTIITKTSRKASKAPTSSANTYWRHRSLFKQLLNAIQYEQAISNYFTSAWLFCSTDKLAPLSLATADAG